MSGVLVGLMTILFFLDWFSLPSVLLTMLDYLGVLVGFRVFGLDFCSLLFLSFGLVLFGWVRFGFLCCSGGLALVFFLVCL